MRLAGLIAMTLLSVGVVVEGAYILSLRREVLRVGDQVRQLAEEGQGDRVVPERSWRSTTTSRDPQVAAPAGGGSRPVLPVPRFVNAAAPVTGPLPQLETPEAREQVRLIVAAELERARQERDDQSRQARDQREQQRMDAIVKALGLNQDQAKRFGDAMAAAQDGRRQLRERMEKGQVQRADIGKEMQALRDQSRGQIQQAIGADKMAKLEELERQDRGGSGGSSGRDRGFGGGWRGGPSAAQPAQ